MTARPVRPCRGTPYQSSIAIPDPGADTQTMLPSRRTNDLPSEEVARGCWFGLGIGRNLGQPMSTRAAEICAVILLLAALVCARGDEPSPVTVAEINRILQSPAETAPKSLRFHGVVIHWAANPRGVFVQEGRSGVFVRFSRDLALPALGDELEVTVQAHFVSPGPDTEIDAVAVRVLGHPGLPEPIRCSLVETTTGQYNRLAVQVEGKVIHTSRHFGVPWLMLSDASGAAMVGIYSWPQGWNAGSLLGKRVRLRGVAAGVWAQALRCTSPQEITVIDTPAADDSNKPLQRVAEVLAYHPPPIATQMQPVLLKAVCTRADAAAKEFAIHDGQDGLLVHMPLYDPGGVLPSPGDEVSLAGVAASVDERIWVNAWTVEIVGRRDVPSRAPSTFSAPHRTVREVLASPASRERIVVSGMVICASSSGGEIILLVQDATGTVYVYSPEAPAGTDKSPPPLPKLGDHVEVEGLHPTIRTPSPQLFEAVWRVTGHELLAEAPLVPMADAMAVEYDGRRVRMQGRVIAYENFVEREKTVSRIWLRAGDVVTYGNYLSDMSAPAPAKVGQLVEIAGVCNVAEVAPNVVRSFSVLLHSMADARPVPEPPPWSDPATRRLVGVAAISLAAAAAWVILLRRQVHRRTADLAAREVQLRQALAQEQELGNLKTAFIAMVSHEFRTPLNVIVTSSDILSRYFDRLPEEERTEHLGSIQKSIKRMAGMMDDVLLLGRFDAGQQKLQPAELHLAAWCRRFVDEMRSATSGRCPIELFLAEFEPIVRADEGILRHILANLLSNAVKYSRPGEAVHLRVEQQGADAVFTVADHGIGIPVTDRRRLFESFQRGGNVGQISGTGLGLVVVKRGVDLHGGTVAFTSEESTGTTFTVRLPLFDEPKMGKKL